MESKKQRIRYVLLLAATLLSCLGFVRALDHGTSTQVAASAGGFIIFISLLIVFLYKQRKLL
jgi:hypothetical protein